MRKSCLFLIVFFAVGLMATGELLARGGGGMRGGGGGGISRGGGGGASFSRSSVSRTPSVSRPGASTIKAAERLAPEPRLARASRVLQPRRLRVHVPELPARAQA